jgi:hypothetical protein
VLFCFYAGESMLELWVIYEDEAPVSKRSKLPTKCEEAI